MSNSTNISLEGNFYSPVAIRTLTSVRFWLFLISDILSILCSLLVLYFILFDRTLRRALNNHVIIILLIIGLINELTGTSWILHYFLRNVPLIQTSLFYLFGFFFDYGIYTTQIILFSWATIERHILIFHDQWVSTRKKRFFVHYLPIIAILTYCLVYYSLSAFGPFCNNSFGVFIAESIYIPCAYTGEILRTWDLLAHQVIPTLIIVIFSIALLGRVLRQKRRVNQAIQWRRYRKMTIQLLLISSLYLIFNSPWTILNLILRYYSPDVKTKLFLTSLIYFHIYVIFLFPFVCGGSLPELRKKFKQRVLFWRQRQQVAPHMPLKIMPRVGGLTVAANNLMH